jgi:hypothetical protein
MRLLFHKLGSWSAAAHQPDRSSSADTHPDGGDRAAISGILEIRRNGNRLHTVNFVSRPSGPRPSGRRPHWSAARGQTRLSAMRQAS